MAEGLHRRRFLKATALAGGAAVGGTLNALNDVDWRDLKTPAEKIAYYRSGDGGFDTDTDFRAAADTPVQGMEAYTREGFVRYVFSNAVPTKMPTSIRDKLATVAPGIPAQETRYDNNLPPSRSGAKYIWQFTPGAVDDLNTKMHTAIAFEQTKSLKVATPLAFAYFDRVIYEVVAPPARKVLEQFGLADNTEAVEQFTIYCMIDAYNAGPTRMAKVLDAFAARHSSSSVSAVYEYTPLSLFQAVAETALRPPGALDPRYKKEAGEYVFQVLAGAESLHPEYRLQFEKSPIRAATDAVRHGADVALQTGVKPAAAGTAGGLIGGVVAGATTQSLERPSRRTVAAAAFAAAIGVAARHFSNGTITLPKRDDLTRLFWWRSDAKIG